MVVRLRPAPVARLRVRVVDVLGRDGGVVGLRAELGPPPETALAGGQFLQPRERSTGPQPDGVGQSSREVGGRVPLLPELVHEPSEGFGDDHRTPHGEVGVDGPQHPHPGDEVRVEHAPDLELLGAPEVVLVLPLGDEGSLQDAVDLLVELVDLLTEGLDERPLRLEGGAEDEPFRHLVRLEHGVDDLLQAVRVDEAAIERPPDGNDDVDHPLRHCYTLPFRSFDPSYGG